MPFSLGEAVLKGTLKLVFGSSAAKLIGILSMPVLTRIYSVEDIGVLAVLNSLVMLLVPIMTLRYVVTIPLPRTDTFAFGVVILALGLSVTILASLQISLFFLPVEEYLIESMKPVGAYLWLVPLLAFGVAANEILTMWLTRRKEYGSIGRVQVIQTFSGEMAKVATGFFGWKPIGLLIGQAAYVMVGLCLLISSVKKGQSGQILRFRLRPTILALWRYRSVPTFRLPAQFLLIFAMQAPQLFSVWFYSTSDAGLVGMAVMALALPFSVIGQAAGRAYYAEISALGKNNPNEIQRLTRYLTKKLILFSLPVSVIFYSFGEIIFQYVFGAEWKVAGQLASTMSIYLVFQFSVSPMLSILNVFDAQEKFLFVHMQRAVLITLAFLTAHHLNLTIENAILLYSISLALHYIRTAYLLHSLLKKKCAES